VPLFFQTDAHRMYPATFTPVARGNMNPLKIAGILLVAAGALGLVYGSFSYTKATHEAKIGPLDLAVHEKETVNVPVWAGVAAIVAGCGLLLVGGKRA
jgi:drug/metabolite transporter (DMT)-like permease